MSAKESGRPLVIKTPRHDDTFVQKIVQNRSDLFEMEAQRGGIPGCKVIIELAAASFLNRVFSSDLRQILAMTSNILDYVLDVQKKDFPITIDADLARSAYDKLKGLTGAF